MVYIYNRYQWMAVKYVSLPHLFVSSDTIFPAKLCHHCFLLLLDTFVPQHIRLIYINNGYYSKSLKVHMHFCVAVGENT